jgi:DNA (cytosine-5)-methyltransferase 1
LNIPEKVKNKFRRCLLGWYRENKRDFPWRYSKDPYKIIISEILLQKTDAPKVLPVYRKFIKKYPNANSLQKAKLSDVKKLIESLGLLYRAERLISIGKVISASCKRTVPCSKKELLELKGLGQYAASAVRCFAFNKREAIVDNNVVRVMERVFGFRSNKNRPRDDMLLWKFAESLLPARKFEDYNYALLDFSALQCTTRNPDHKTCPLKKICHHYGQIKQQKNKPLGIDLYAGAGGLSYGFEQAGFKIIYALENDKSAAETYMKNRTDNKDLIVDVEDINNVSPQKLLDRLGLEKGELDIIIGGPPCQGFSISNKKTRNMDNPNNRMVFKFIDFVREMKPKWFLMENVAGLDSFENGSLRDALINLFRSIGYTTDYMILNSVNFRVPQVRNRIFFIGNCVGNSMEEFAKIRNKTIKSPVTVYDAISDLPKLNNGNSIDEMCYNSRKKKITKFQVNMRRGMNGKVNNNIVTTNTKLVIKRYKHIKQGENLLSLAKKTPDLVANYKKINNTHHWIYMRLRWDKPSVTLNNYRKNMLIHPTQNRGLSVREAARLQSIPDRYKFYGTISYQQQQASNAVPPLLAENIASCIKREL